MDVGDEVYVGVKVKDGLGVMVGVYWGVSVGVGLNTGVGVDVKVGVDVVSFTGPNGAYQISPKGLLFGSVPPMTQTLPLKAIELKLILGSNAGLAETSWKWIPSEVSHSSVLPFPTL